MGDQLSKQIPPNQDTEWRQERSARVESDGVNCMRRRSIEVRASGGFGSLEQIPTKIRNWVIAPGLCSGEQFWRRNAQADKD
jgi:hypothetical protein